MAARSETAPARVGARAGVAPRGAFWVGGLAVVSGLVYLMATADTGPADPTEVQQSHGTRSSTRRSSSSAKALKPSSSSRP